MEENALFAHFPQWLRQPRVLVPLLLLLATTLIVGAVLAATAPPPSSTPAPGGAYPAPGGAARPRAQSTGATNDPAALPSASAAPPPRVELRPSAARPGYAWLIATVDPQMYTGYGTSLALDGQERPRIAYRIAGTDYKDLLYAWTGPDINGGPWFTTTVDTPGDCGIDPSLELDGAGDPRISYNCNNCLLYAHDDGSGWQIETVACGEGWYGWCTSLELDSQGHPRISYLAGWPVSDLMYAWYDGVQWQHETIDSQGIVGLYTSLALDSQDQPRISYYDDDSCALKYAWHDGTAWHLEIVDSGCVNQRGIGKYTSLALDAQDHPHISYYDDAHYELRYAHFDGTRWLTETVDTGGYLTGAYTSLALDAQGRPHISYLGNRYLRHAHLIELPYAVFLPRVER